MKRFAHAVPVVLTLSLAAPELCRAQATNGNSKLANILTDLYIDKAVTDAIIIADVFGSDAPADLLDQVFFAVEPAFQLNKLIGAQLTSFPMGSSAGGFSWTFDPTQGTFNRGSGSFGPAFAERALTVGRRRLNVGMNYQRATFDSIENRKLRDGDVNFYIGACIDVDCGFGVFFEESLDLKLVTNTTGIFATYGITDRLDVGVAVPIVHVDVEASLTGRVGTISQGIRPDATEFRRSQSGSATGVGDIVVRAKYNFYRIPGGGLAAGVDWRLPTGDEENLLGVAGPQGKIYLAVSGARGRLSPHLNFGYTVSGDTAAGRSETTAVFPPPDEWNYAGGVDVAASQRLTISGDVLGRDLRDIGGLVDTESPFGSNFRQFGFADNANVNLLLGAVGAKYNVLGNALVAGNVLFPLNKAGLRDNLTWVFGLEYSF